MERFDEGGSDDLALGLAKSYLTIPAKIEQMQRKMREDTAELCGKDSQEREADERKVITEISGGQSKRKGRATVPRPRLT